MMAVSCLHANMHAWLEPSLVVILDSFRATGHHKRQRHVHAHVQINPKAQQKQLCNELCSLLRHADIKPQYRQHSNTNVGRSAIPLKLTCHQISALKVAAPRKNVMHIALKQSAAHLGKLRQAAAAEEEDLELFASLAQQADNHLICHVL